MPESGRKFLFAGLEDVVRLCIQHLSHREIMIPPVPHGTGDMHKMKLANTNTETLANRKVRDFIEREETK